MSDEAPKQPERAVTHRRRLSWVWLIPLASVAIGAWLLWTTLSRRGPTIEVTFNSAEGMQAGQSQMKYKDIQMGTVESFKLTPDRNQVVMTIRTTAQAEPLLTKGAKFWINKPQFFAGAISGLETILSGAYVAMQPGDAGAPEERRFQGQPHPPLDPGIPGRRFKLTAPRLGALNIGSPLFFHQVEVGQVMEWKLSGMAEQVTFDVFVRSPYDSWVHDDSRFWDSSGVSVSLGANGIQLQMDSIKAALLGGVNFDTPAHANSPVSAAGHEFTLYPNSDLAQTATAPLRSALITYLDGTVGGLAKGAPVTLLGERVGDVTKVTLQFDTDDNKSRVRVDFVIDPALVATVGNRPALKFPAGWQTLVDSGLRAHLTGGNLLTGQKQLSMEFDETAPHVTLHDENGVPVIPSLPGGSGIDSLTSSANEILAKVNAIPFAQIGRHLDETLSGSSRVLNGPELRQALTRLNSSLASVQQTVRHIDDATAPALKRLPAIAADLQQTLAQVRSLASSVGQGTAGDSKFARDLDQMLVQVSDAVESVRMVADLLAQHPEALIRGRVIQRARQP